MAGRSPPRAPLYHRIAEHLEQSIRSGAFAPGDRLPSVRELGRSWDASITTVAAAFALLARRGLAEPRPQSGHFACRPPEPPGDDRPARPSPTGVGLGQLALMVMRDSLDPGLVPFGPALPDPALLPDVELRRILAAVARSGAAGIDRYDVPPGARELRAAIARRATRAGWSVSPDAIVATGGALSALNLALRATCAAGDTVAIESPLYYGLLQSIEAIGLKVVEIPTDPRDGLSLTALRETLDDVRIAAVVAMTGGSNPLGSRCPEARKRELVELLAEHSIPLIEDDALGELVHDGAASRPAKAFDRRGLVLWCSSFSKTAAPGLRLGWIAPGRWQAAVEHLQFTTDVGLSPLTQAVMTRFLQSGGYDRFLRRVRPIYAARTAAMAEAVLRCLPAGTRVTRPEVGFVLWVELPGQADAQALYASALRAGISITPGPLFSPKLRYRRFIRLNASRWSPELEPALRQVGALANHQSRERR